MNNKQTLAYSARFALRQFTYNKTKMITAILGVTFACFLIFMQLGFKDSLFASIRMVPSTLNGDLFLVNKQSEAIWRSASFARNDLYEVYANPAVSEVIPLYLGFVKFKNPIEGYDRTILTWGYDPQKSALSIAEIDDNATNLSQVDTVLFDSLSRPEYGDITAYLENGPATVEIGNKNMTIVGTFPFGASFSTEGNIVTNSESFFKIMPYRNKRQVDIGVIRVDKTQDILTTQSELQKIISNDLDLLTKEEFTNKELHYWENTAPIGFIFGIGAVMGFLVGLVLVYQVLYSDISNNYKEYSTLLALGYSFNYLVCYISAYSVLIGSLGFVPGYFLSHFTYKITEGVTYIPMPMPPSKILFVYVIILIMCGVSSILAMKKLKSANPADMF